MTTTPGGTSPGRLSGFGRELVLAGATLLLIVVMGVITGGRFTQPENLSDLLLNCAIPLVAASGMTVLIVSAQIDISIGAILAVAAMTIATLAARGMPLPVLGAAGIAVGCLLGAVNGFLCAGLKIPSIVTTLATLGAIKGLLVLFTRGTTVPVPPSVSALGGLKWVGVPMLAWVSAGVAAAVGIYLARTRPGRRHYAVGSNPRSAELSGIPAGWTTFWTFVLLGGLVGLAALLYVMRFTPIDPRPQPGFELMVITAVVVGGTDIFGGRGTMLGTALAMLLLKTIDSSLTFVGSLTPALRSEIQPAIQGALVLAAVLYSSFTRRDTRI